MLIILPVKSVSHVIYAVFFLLVIDLLYMWSYFWLWLGDLDIIKGNPIVSLC
jgi:hypothetical protein